MKGRHGPLPAMVVFFMAGLLLARAVPELPGAGLALPGVFLLAAAVACARPSRLTPGALSGAAPVLFALFFLASGLAAAQVERRASARDLARLSPAGPFLVRGEVRENSGRSIILRVSGLETARGSAEATGLLFLRPVGGPLPVRAGDLVEARVSLPENGPGRVSAAALAPVRPGELAIVGRRDFSRPHRFFRAARRELARLMRRRVPGEPEGSVLRALSFSLERPGPAVREVFRKAGVYHLLVVSGFHAGFMVLVFHLLLSPWPLSPRARAFLHLPLLAFYAFLCDLNTPVVRACLMAGFYLLGQVAGRPSRPLNALAMAAFALLVVSPGELFAPGWQLSFGITACLVLGVRPLADRFPKIIPGKISLALASALLAWLVSTPMTAWHFGAVPLLALPANLALVPLAAVSVMLVLPGLLPAPLGGVVFSRANQAVLTLLYRAAHRVSEIPWAFREVEPGRPAWLLACLGAALIVIFLAWSDRRNPAARSEGG